MLDNPLTEFLDLAVWAMLAGVLSFAVAAFGLKRVLPTLGATAIALFGAMFLRDRLNIHDTMLPIIDVCLFLVTGFVLGRLFKTKSKLEIRNKIALKINEISSDYRIQVIAASLLFAVLATYFFGRLRVIEADRGFWHGFYEAWTANIVFFSILGISGTIVTLYRPEKDEFHTRVKILCSGRDDSTVDYIREKVRELGYYSENMAKIYEIEKFDAERMAYEIKVTTVSTLRNFFDDEAHDRAGLSLTPDPLAPPLDSYGTLISVFVNNILIYRAEEIPLSGIKKHWQVDLPKGGKAQIKFTHRMWYRHDIEHKILPLRFTREVKTSVLNYVPGHDIEITCRSNRRISAEDLKATRSPSQEKKTFVLKNGDVCPEILPALNCLPGDVAILMTLRPVSSQPGTGLVSDVASSTTGPKVKEKVTPLTGGEVIEQSGGMLKPHDSSANFASGGWRSCSVVGLGYHVCRRVMDLATCIRVSYCRESRVSSPR